jgi:serine/threonine protein kinase
MLTEQFCENCGARNTYDDTLCFNCGVPLSPEQSAVTTDSTSATPLRNHYRILSQVGSGGFSAVYKAQDTTTQRIVAIKAISLRGLRAQEKIEATDAFNREVKLLSTLQHRNLPRIIDHFTEPECWYVVMEFIEGTPLEKRLEQAKSSLIPLVEAIDIFLVLCNILHYLHSQTPAIIYRDLKPANIMLTPSGRLFLVDFGIARLFKPGQSKDTLPFGSPGYAAPEQYGKAQSTTRTDIYSLGVIMHQLLSGDDPTHNPFIFTSLGQQRPEVASLEPLVTSMVSRIVDERPADITLVQKALQKFMAQYRAQQFVLHPLLPPVAPNPHSHSYVVPYYPSTIPSYSPHSMAGNTAQAQTMFHTPQTQQAPANQNSQALASLLCGIMGIFLFPLTACLGSVMHLNMLSFHPLSLPLLLLAPSTAGIILGHLGKRHARSNVHLRSTSEVANTGLIISYLFGSIYLLIILCQLLAVLLTHFSYN